MIRSVTAAAVVMSFCWPTAHAQLAQYTAHYSAEYKGRNVGESVFMLQFDDELGRYVFSSTLRAKGLLKIVSPRPVIDRSEFLLDDSGIVPQKFVHEDGSRKGKDNHTIVFDWDTASATVTGDDYTRELPLSEGALDRGSLQIALIQAIGAGRQPRLFTVVDDDSIDEYVYEFEGKDSIATGLGDVDVLRYRQQRTGSSRVTMIDIAPELGYVPARIEQIRGGESQSSFLIESLERP